MSTRGWYEFYVVDDARKEVSLAIQFYKWGDATPENALAELGTLREVTDRLQRVPVQLTRELLRDNLGSAFEQLPASFSLGCYYFFLQRAAEEERLAMFRLGRFADLPKEQRPDYQLGFAVGESQVLAGYRPPPKSGDPVVDRAHFSIAVATLVRRWRECSTSMNFLRWLQYVTQITKEIDMGCLAGDYEPPWDIAHLYRFFFRVPELAVTDQRVEEIELELCDRGGKPLPGQDAGAAERDELRALFEREGFRPASLSKVLETHELVSSALWTGQLPRHHYLGP